jgi:O-antigen/teichoic acid export membrane protein
VLEVLKNTENIKNIVKVSSQQKNTIIYFFSSWIFRAINFVQFIMIARVLDPSQVGMYQYAVSFANIFFSVSTLGTNQFSFRNFSDNSINVYSLLKLSLNLRLVVFLLGIFALFILSTLNIFRVDKIIWFALVWNALEIGVIHLFSIFLRAKQQAIIDSILQFLKSSICLFVVIIILKFRPSLQNLFLGLIFANLTLVILYYLYIRPYIFSGDDKTFTYFSIIKTLILSWLVEIFGAIMMELGVIFLKFYANSVEIANYSVASKLILPMMTISIAFNTAYQPQIVVLYSKYSSKWKKLTIELIAFSAIVNFLISVFFFLFGPKIIGLLYGEKFAGSQYLITYLSFFPFLFSLSSSLDVVLVTKNRWDVIAISTFVAVLFIVGTNIVLTPHMGAMGATLSFLLSFIVKIICSSFWIKF